MNNSKVSIIKCDDYDPQEVYRSIQRAIETSGGFPDVEGKSVLLKPNLLYPVSPEKAVTTHPAIVEALIRIVQERGASSVIVGDSPGVASMDNAGRKSGVREVVFRRGAQWLDFAEPALLEYREGVI